VASRGFLTSGVLADGLVGPTDEGTPQGGPLSPLLSNLMLDELDKELERRGHCFARYADDCNIYVRSVRAGERVMASVERFLARRLKLKINTDKSAVAPPQRRKFLGFSFTGGATPKRRIAPQAVARFKERARTDAADAGCESRQDRRETVALSDRMARLFRHLRDAFGVARARPVDQAQASIHRLEAMETRTHPLCGTAPPRRGARIWRRKPPAVPTAPGGSATVRR